MTRRIGAFVGISLLLGLVAVLIYGLYWSGTPEGRAAEHRSSWCDYQYARARTHADTLIVDRGHQVPNPSKMGHVNRSTCGEYRRLKESTRPDV